MKKYYVKITNMDLNIQNIVVKIKNGLHLKRKMIAMKIIKKKNIILNKLKYHKRLTLMIVHIGMNISLYQVKLKSLNYLRWMMNNILNKKVKKC